jgi:hypothetical protein
MRGARGVGVNVGINLSTHLQPPGGAVMTGVTANFTAD